MQAISSSSDEAKNPCHDLFEEPTVSVIVPIFNAEEYLEQTLESIESQEGLSLEIICVDDCSTDGSFDIAEKHASCDARYRLIAHPSNRGTGAALNSGISAAQGAYIQLLGNDDLLSPYALKELVNRCEEQKLDMLMYGMDVFTDDPSDPALADRAASQEKYHHVGHEYPICTGVELLKLMTEYREYRMTNSPIIVRHDFLATCEPWNIEGIRHEDMFYTYNLLLHAQRCTLIPNKYYQYRIRIGSQEDGKASNPKTVEEAEALLVSSHAMLQATPDELLSDPDFSDVLEKRIYAYIKRCAKWYGTFDAAECDWLVHSRFREVRYASAAFQRARDLEQSNSFLLGRKLTAVPRAIKRTASKKNRKTS